MPATANQKVTVHLSAEQRQDLGAILRQQTVPAATARRARVLLLADEGHPDGQRPDPYIAAVVGVSARQVARIRQRFAHGGLAPAVDRQARAPSAAPPKLDGAAEARLVTLCCSTPPDGRSRWTLQLLVDELCRLRVVVSVCRETVRQCLKKTGFNLGGASGSASRRRTGRGSSPRWRRSSTRTTPRTTRRVR
jgi:transposase